MFTKSPQSNTSNSSGLGLAAPTSSNLKNSSPSSGRSAALEHFQEFEAFKNFDIRFLKGVGDKISGLLGNAGIRNLWDLLTFFPRTYEDRRKMPGWSEVVKASDSGSLIQGRAIIEKISPRFGGGGKKWFEGVAKFLEPGMEPSALGEPTNSILRPGPRILFTWFHVYGPPLDKKFPPGTAVFFRGKAQNYRGQVQCVHPDLQKTEVEAPEFERGIVPIYREIGGLSTRLLRKIIFGALHRPELEKCPDLLPQDILERWKFSSWKKCLEEIHFPKNWEPDPVEPIPAGPFFKRIVFEELLIVSLALLLRRTLWKSGRVDEKGHTIPPQIFVDQKKLDSWISSLPFTLTGDQSKALDDICQDMALASGRVSMHRLVQGDVGSGKTIVAFLAALSAIQSGFQVALMAPTEILADQHFANFKKLFPDRSEQVVLLKGALTAAKKRDARELISTGKYKLVIGTQALLTEDTVFESLGLVIIDEQHRFGVAQRWQLKNREQKDGPLQPHLLVMSATPIPRSLALTFYGDLDMSIIRQKPVGRQPIETHLLRQRQRKSLEARLQKFVSTGQQIYIVYPLVEESEELDLKDVKTAFDEWSQVFGKSRVALLHGRMKSKDKESVMQGFAKGETQVLVTTTVIEVGVDVPKATVMVIEHAERFGLSQLHQLRGRVGRGSEKSFCVLMASDRLSETAEARLKILVESEDGFVIAEKDLDIRGPGEFLGARQSGVAGFRIAHLLRDQELLVSAREEAEKISKADPLMRSPQGEKLRALMGVWLGGGSRTIDWTSSG